MVEQLDIETEALQPPLEVFTLSYEPLAQITHHTKPLNILVSGNHWESLPFLIF